jgi:hypothetical protein
MVDPNMIRDGLIARGLPAHIAEGFLLNFQDESGFDPSVNERKPLVPGSRGGFGLYQLTGPRRKQYEAFAQQRGVDPGDVDAQLDFLMMELNSTEKNAARSIFSAPDVGTAAAAIVKDFLRPSPEYRDERIAKYLGGASAPIAQSTSMQAPTETNFANGYQAPASIDQLYGQGRPNPLAGYNPYAIAERFRLT